MTRWLHRLLSSRDTGSAVAAAKHYSRLAVQCAHCGQPGSARECRQIRDSHLWAARELAMRPSKRKACPAQGADRVNRNVTQQLEIP